MGNEDNKNLLCTHTFFMKKIILLYFSNKLNITELRKN